MTFEELIRRHAADLFRYAYWLARDRHRAEDIVQEALLRGWRAFPRLREAGAAKAWLFSIVRNEFLRAKAGEAPHVELLESMGLPDERPEFAGLEMREALALLPVSYAEPLALQVLGGFSGAEIAEMLGVSEGAAMTRLARARQALRRIVAPGGERSLKGGRS